MPASTVLDQILLLLNENGVPFREVHHAPTFTSAQSAEARGEDLRTGGKALLIKANSQFLLFVLPADRKLDSAAVRKELNVKKLRFATRDELKELTGLEPGSVPPFGQPILPFELYVDSGISESERIAFNAGSLTDSIILSVENYLKVSSPTRQFAFSLRD